MLFFSFSGSLAGFYVPNGFPFFLGQVGMRARMGFGVLNVFFSNSNSFGVFSHSKGFGEELLSDSLWVLWPFFSPKAKLGVGGSFFFPKSRS